MKRFRGFKLKAQLGRFLCVLMALLTFSIGAHGENGVIRYGITPYQDSALPVVAARLGWYKSQRLDVELIPLEWGDIPAALSSGAINLAIYNLNSFMAPYQNAAQRSPKPVFFAPLYVFKGQAIMVHGGRGLATTESPDGKSLEQIAAQLTGMRIGVTEGTELEQIVLAALKRAGLNTSDAQIIHSSPADALAAFLSGNLDAFAAGLTERVEARRHGGIELLTASDVMEPVIDGIVSTDQFVHEQTAALDKLTQAWFQTIRYISSDVETNSREIREYLRTTASTRYTEKEYAIAWTFDIFPLTAQAANDMFNNSSSKFWWKSSWDSINNFLLANKKITVPVPYAAYLGAETLPRIARLPDTR